MNGIDISNWQAGISPSALPIDFCICKATEGIGYTDKTCDGFIQNCIQHNILWGFYHFARENNPESEAEYFYKECKNYFNHGIPVLDYETTNSNNVDWCERFINRLHELSGVWCMLYTSASWCGQFEGSWIPETCGLWVAGYPYVMGSFNEAGKMPYNIYPWKFAAIWQFTSNLRLSGYDGNLDGNIGYLDREAWMKWANSNDSAEEPEKPIEKPIEKSIDDYAREVVLGEYGNGEDRKRMLGGKYDEVQNRVNELFKIADEVIHGDWGNGWNRQNALEGAGYPYDVVQKIVNDKLN